MANPTVDALRDEYAELLEDCYDRWSGAVVDAKNGTYTADRFVSDATAHWADLLTGWLLPVNTLLQGLKAVPQLSLQIAAAGGSATGALMISDPGTATISATPLNDLGATQAPIPAMNVNTYYFQPTRILVVQIVGLGALTQGTTYKGSIIATSGGQQRTLVDVFLTVI